MGGGWAGWVGLLCVCEVFFFFGEGWGCEREARGVRRGEVVGKKGCGKGGLEGLRGTNPPPTGPAHFQLVLLKCVNGHSFSATPPRLNATDTVYLRPF